MSEPESALAVGFEQEAKDAIESYRRFLSSPAFQHTVDLAVLVKVAGDERAPMRDRLRAAEVLAKLRLEAMAAVASLTGAREQRLDAMGLKPGPQTLALTNVNQKIEIVRASDWRNAPALKEAVDVEAKTLPEGSEDAADPAP